MNNALEELRDQVVFVGGATISLYADRPVLKVRPTNDIDVIVEILNYKQRQQLEELLREIGFTNDVESGIICLFKIKGIDVDIMPTEACSCKGSILIANPLPQKQPSQQV